MKDYKKQALRKFDLKEEYSVYFLKNRLENRICDKCRESIKKGEVYFCHKWISSYLVDYFGDYHLNCVSKEDILKMLHTRAEYENLQE